MRFCKKCHRRVIETITTNGCVCITSDIPRGTEAEGTINSIIKSYPVRGVRRRVVRGLNRQGDGPLVVTRET